MVFKKQLCLGFELEGGFDNDLREMMSNEIKPKRKEFLKLLREIKATQSGDGSIYSNKGMAREIKSGIYEIKTKKDLKEIIEHFKKISGFMTDANKSCGIHIHISFKDLADYYTLLNFNFADNFLKKYKQKFKTSVEQQRLTNQYCKKYEDENDFKKTTKKQLNCMGKGFRYYTINYNAYNNFKTIEFRLFPSTTSDKKFKDYVYFLYDYIINFLKEHDDGRIKTELINKQRKFNKDTEDEIIIITEESINEDEFKNYEDRKRKEKEEREHDEITSRRILEINTKGEDEDDEEDEEYYETTPSFNPFRNDNDEDNNKVRCI